MYCKKCGTQLDEGTEFCPKCGMAPKKSYWWILGLMVLIIVVGSAWGLNKLNILSVDSYLAKFAPVNMKPYFPLPSEDMVYVGHSNDKKVVIEFKFEDEVTIDGKQYYVRTKKMTVNDAVYPSFEFLYYDQDEVVMGALSSDEYGAIYNKSFDYDLLSTRDIIMPSALKLGEPIKFESDSKSETYTLLAFEDVIVNDKTYYNTALIEIISYNHNNPISKEWIYHAKNVGIVKVLTYNMHGDGEWKSDVLLELKAKQ